MKPRNFPQRKLRRQAIARYRARLPTTEAQDRAYRQPADIRIRIGAANRNN